MKIEQGVKEKDGNKKSAGTTSLAFRVKPHPDNLFSAEVLLLVDDVVVDRRETVATTLGHAIGAADDLMDGWAVSQIERKAEDFFRDVIV